MKKIISLTILLVFISNNIYLTNAQKTTYSCDSQEIKYDYVDDDKNWIIKYNIINNDEYKYLDVYVNPLSKDFSWYQEMMKNKNIASLEFADTNKQYLVWNWKKYETYDYVWWEDYWIYLFFSSDKSSVSYISWDYSKKEMFVIKDWVKQQSYLSISRILNYAPNSNTLVYDAINKDYKKVININWDEILDYQFDNYPNLYYSKDWKYLYAIWDISGKNNLVTCDISNNSINNNKETQTVNNISDIKTTKQEITPIKNKEIEVRSIEEKPKTITYKLSSKEKEAINIVADKIDKMGVYKRKIYLIQLNQLLNKFEKWSKKYEIVNWVLNRLDVLWLEHFNNLLNN